MAKEKQGSLKETVKSRLQQLLKWRSHYYIALLATLGVVLIAVGLSLQQEEIDPNENPQFFVGAALEEVNQLREDGKIDEAIAFIEETTPQLSADSGPNAYILYAQLGQLKQDVGDMQGAYRAFQQAIGYFDSYDSFRESENYAPVELVQQAAFAADAAGADAVAFQYYQQLLGRFDESPEKDNENLKKQVEENFKEVQKRLTEEAQKPENQLPSGVQTITL